RGGGQQRQQDDCHADHDALLGGEQTTDVRTALIIRRSAGESFASPDPHRVGAAGANLREAAAGGAVCNDRWRRLASPAEPFSIIRGARRGYPRPTVSYWQFPGRPVSLEMATPLGGSGGPVVGAKNSHDPRP